RFRFDYQAEQHWAGEESGLHRESPLKAPPRAERPALPFRAICAIAWWDFRYIVRSVYFALMLLAGSILLLASVDSMGNLWGTPTYPVTYRMVDVVQGTFALVAIGVITFYSGQLVWRERKAGMDEIAGVLPVSEWSFLLGKLGALFT